MLPIDQGLTKPDSRSVLTGAVSDTISTAVLPPLLLEKTLSQGDASWAVLLARWKRVGRALDPLRAANPPDRGSAARPGSIPSRADKRLPRRARVGRSLASASASASTFGGYWDRSVNRTPRGRQSCLRVAGSSGHAGCFDEHQSLHARRTRLSIVRMVLPPRRAPRHQLQRLSGLQGMCASFKPSATA